MTTCAVATNQRRGPESNSNAAAAAASLARNIMISPSRFNNMKKTAHDLKYQPHITSPHIYAAKARQTVIKAYLKHIAQICATMIAITSLHKRTEPRPLRRRGRHSRRRRRRALTNQVGGAQQRRNAVATNVRRRPAIRHFVENLQVDATTTHTTHNHQMDAHTDGRTERHGGALCAHLSRAVITLIASRVQRQRGYALYVHTDK